MSGLRRYTPDEAGAAASDEKLLVARIKRLVTHPGYDRAQVTSDALKRYLPTADPSAGPWVEAGILQRLQATQPNASTRRYLFAALDLELAAARSSVTDGRARR